VIYDEKVNQNPFRELIPLTKEYGVLFHAILATSALHLSNVIQRQHEIKPAQMSLSNLDTILTKAANVIQNKKAPPLSYQHALLAKQKNSTTTLP